MNRSSYYVGDIKCVPSDLKHFGIKGMSWGRRRFQNEDGSLTSAGKQRYGIGDAIGGAARSVGNTVSGAARSVGSAVSGAARSAQSAVSSGVRSVDRMLGVSASRRLDSARSEHASVSERRMYNQRNDNAKAAMANRNNQQAETNNYLSTKAQAHESSAKEAHATASQSAAQALSTRSISAGEKAANDFLTAIKTETYHSEAAKAYRLLMLQNQPQSAETYTDGENRVNDRLAARESELQSEIEELEKEVDSSVLGRVKKTFGKGRNFVAGLFGRR